MSSLDFSILARLYSKLLMLIGVMWVKTTRGTANLGVTETSYCLTLQRKDGNGGQTMPPSTKFNDMDVEKYLEAVDRRDQLLSLYEQVCHARLRAEEDETQHSQSIETECLTDYLEATGELAILLSNLADRIPFSVLTDLLKKLPKPVVEDIQELQRT